MFARAAFALWLGLAVAACGRPARAPVPARPEPAQIARADLFGEPVRQDAQLAPRGDRIAFLAPRDGALNIWVVSVSAMDQPTPVTDDQGRGIRRFAWAQDNATLLYAQDQRGDENWQVFAVPAAGGEARALTPQGARAEIIGLNAADPNGVIVTLNQRDRAWPDVFRIDIATGERTLLVRNTNTAASRGFSSFMVDRNNDVRLGLKSLADGGVEVLTRNGESAWASLFTIPFEDALGSRPIAFEADGRSFLMLDSTGRDRAALVRVDATSGVRTVIGESPLADVVDVWLDPQTNAPEAYAAEYLRGDWRALDADAQADLDVLDQQLAGEARVVSRSADDSRWIVEESAPTIPTRSYLYDRGDRANRRVTLLFRQHPQLESAALQPMTPVEIEARDGLTLVSYLTLPVGSDANGDARPDAPVPLVLAPHAGPWSRDSYGYNPLHQWLANRGYAVLSVNFRGSTGFGKAFLNAGNREWGGRMQEDLLDAVQWAVETGVAQPERVAILGRSYGGYAAIAGLAFTPERFRCAVSYGAPLNLTSMLERAPSWWAPFGDALKLRVGDAGTPEGRQVLRERSPLTRASAITNPLLLTLGAQDPLASRADTDALAQNLRGRARQLVYVVFPDEGRTLARAHERLSFYAVAEQFLAGCLGGRIEPVGAAFDGARVEAFDGAASVSGLSAFAARATPLSAPAQAAPNAEESDGSSDDANAAAPARMGISSGQITTPQPPDEEN